MTDKRKKTAKLSPKRRAQAKGTELFNQVVALTGIPAKSIHKELKAILERKKIDIDSLTLDQLRQVVASYLRETLGGLLDRGNTRKPDETH